MCFQGAQRFKRGFLIKVMLLGSETRLPSGGRPACVDPRGLPGEAHANERPVHAG